MPYDDGILDKPLKPERKPCILCYGSGKLVAPLTGYVVTCEMCDGTGDDKPEKWPKPAAQQKKPEPTPSLWKVALAALVLGILWIVMLFAFRWY